MPLCAAIYDAVTDKKSVMMLNQELGSQELRYWIGQCDYFIASRFHAMVSSLAMQVPTLVIGWSHKYREVLEMFELEEWAFGQDKLSQPHLRREFDRLVKETDSVKEKLARHLPQVKKKSFVQVDVIKKIIT
jgi:polysaccharide pyruvyl transferase WcaK-like protein